MYSEKVNRIHSDIRGPIFEEAMRMQSAGIPVLKLNTGNPATFGFQMPDSVRAAISEGMDRAVGYVDMKGLPDAREAICRYHTEKGIKGLSPDDVFFGNGVSELVPMVLQSILNDGDEVLVPSPSYSLWTNSVILSGGKPVFYVCDEKSDWFPDLDSIRNAITPRTRAIVLINPNNPTGALYSNAVLEEICEVARQNKLLICSDEIYDRLLYDGAVHTSTAALAPDVPMVTFNGLSKSHVVCGFRIGWAVVSGPLSKTLMLKQYMTKLCAMRLCGNALGQLAIVAALNDPEFPKQMCSPGGRLYEQRKAALEGLKDIEGLSVVPNQGALYIFPRLDARFNILNDKNFAMDLLHEKNILVIPGSGFDWPYPDHFRLVLLPSVEETTQAMADLKDFLKTYRQI